ncbi:MAG TPA: serine hydrolase domain-containing protein [Actinophytocola sp.]|jgi:CubicO group peptidase (beta-lactamase class C family)|nr:serine hydrolase domain-containing protein [Actinophytocola sp.]
MLHEILDSHVRAGTLPGAVGLVARGDRVEVAAVGSAAFDGAPMAADSIFRIASITKPVTAAALLTLVDEGRLALDDPVREWLPELANPVVVRTPAAPVDDVVPARRPITVFDLLSGQAGFGFASDFSLPAVRQLFAVQRDGREPQSFPPPDEWMAALAAVPLLYQPGESWLYDTCSAVQGVLIARVSGRSLPDFVASRLLAPLGMADSGYVVPAGSLDRFTSYYRADLTLADPPSGQWSTMPAFPLGSGGMVGTAPDYLAFCRMLLAGGVGPSGRLLSESSVRLMTTDHTTAAHREIGALFLEGQGWGFGGGVDIAPSEPWCVPGRYGWVGGTGTTAHIVPSTGTVTILLTQVGTEDPIPPKWMRDFWTYAA